MTSAVRASVVVPTYNRPEVLEECVRALVAQAPDTPAYEVIVVDDGSRADLGARLESLAGAAVRVRYVRHDTNRGRSATRNTGIDLAEGEIVLLVDDDVVVAPHYVSAHLAVHQAAGNAHLVVIGNLSFPPDVVRGSNYGRYLQSRYLGYRRPGDRRGIDPANLHPRFLISAVASMRREDLRRHAPFDAAMRSYGFEDSVAGRRLTGQGLRIVFAPEATAFHRDSVAVPWHRSKMLETARDGVPVLLRHYPDFLDDTAFQSLLPVDWSTDAPGRILRKLLTRAVLNPATLWALEQWAQATDGMSWLYMHAVYRALNAGWFLRGRRMRRDGQPLVVYGS
jgi:glycosyltransferase involved in cell wall biosynthesis